MDEKPKNFAIVRMQTELGSYAVVINLDKENDDDESKGEDDAHE
jgi:hypothetical protein